MPRDKLSKFMDYLRCTIPKTEFSFIKIVENLSQLRRRRFLSVNGVIVEMLFSRKKIGRRAFFINQLMFEQLPETRRLETETVFYKVPNVFR